MWVGWVGDVGRNKTGRGGGGWSSRVPHVHRRKNSDTALSSSGHTENPIRSAPPISPHRRTSRPHSFPPSTHTHTRTHTSSHPTSSTPLLPERERPHQKKAARGSDPLAQRGSSVSFPRSVPSFQLFFVPHISWNATGRARSTVQTRLKRQRVKRTVPWYSGPSPRRVAHQQLLLLPSLLPIVRVFRCSTHKSHPHSPTSGIRPRYQIKATREDTTTPATTTDETMIPFTQGNSGQIHFRDTLSSRRSHRPQQ